MSPEEIVTLMITHDPFSQWMGLELISVKAGDVKVQVTVKPEMLNGFRVTHGGVLFSIADSALAFASGSQGRVAYALNNQITFSKKVNEGDVVTAHAIERALTYKTGTYDVTLTNQNDETVALFRGTVYRSSQTFEELVQERLGEQRNPK
jgi:acyl-CoA thioesterase